MRLHTIVSILAVFLGGCGQADSRNQVTADTRDQVTTDGINAINQFADALDAVKDEDSAKAFEPKVTDFRREMEALSARAAKLPEVPDSEQQAFKAKCLDRINAATSKLGQAVGRIAEDAKARGEPEPPLVGEVLTILRGVPAAARHPVTAP